MLRGYHKCRVEEAIELAAYIYRVRFGEDSSQLENIRYLTFTKSKCPFFFKSISLVYKSQFQAI